MNEQVEISGKGRIKTWLFNPFQYVAGGRALLVGLAVILVSGLITYRGRVYFDGVMDVHIGVGGGLWFFLVQGVINWLCLAVWLYFLGLIVSKSSFRMIDLFGTEALARWPFLIIALVMGLKANREVTNYFISLLKEGEWSVSVNYMVFLVFFVATAVMVSMIVWSVVLMYRAYAISCNLKGAKAVVTFVVGLIGAEIMSKFIYILIAGEIGLEVLG